MKVRFVVPPVILPGDKPAERSSGCTHVVYATPNIYELTVAAYLIEKGHEVSYSDCVNNNIALPALIDTIKSEKTDVCIFWSVNLSLENDIAVGKQLLAEVPDLRLLLLGPAPTYYKDKSLFDSRVTVVRGEAEETVAEILERMSEGKDWTDTAGTSVLCDGKRRDNPMRPLMKSLDHLPIPARELLGDIEYRNPKLKITPYTTMVTSRNCPFHCIYCVPSSMTFARELEHRTHHDNRKPPISFRSVEKVDEELALLHQQGYKAVMFADDNFIWNEKRTEAICNSLRKYGMKWSCQARVDAITENIARMLGESGCMAVDLGVESFNDDVLEYIHKGITSQQIYDAVNILKKHHVPVKMNLLIGTSPLETIDSIKHTIREAKKLKADQLMINIVAPFPGTEFYEMARQNGWIETGDYVPTDVQRHSILNYPHLTSRQMEKILFRSNLTYFLSPSFVIRHIGQFRSMKDFIHALKTLKVKLFG